MNPNDEILDRIAKLMAKAKGTTNENEAAIFAAKAAELLAKHNLDEEMLRARDATREQGPIGAHPYEGRVPDRWRELIVQGCAKLYFCKMMYVTVSGKKKYTLYGREHNAIVAKLMAEYLIATVKRMAREYSPHKATQGDFRRGAGLRLYERLVELYNEQNKPVASTRNTGNLPALYEGESRAVDQFIMDRYGGNIRKAKRKGMKLGSAAGAGMAAANTISLNKQVAEKRSSRLLN